MGRKPIVPLQNLVNECEVFLKSLGVEQDVGLPLLRSPFSRLVEPCLPSMGSPRVCSWMCSCAASTSGPDYFRSRLFWQNHVVAIGRPCCGHMHLPPMDFVSVVRLNSLSFG